MHLMARGQVCGRRDGHTGKHFSVEVAEQMRAYHREWTRKKWAEDPEWRDRVRAKAKDRYATDPEFAQTIRDRTNARVRDKRANDPAWVERERARSLDKDRRNREGTLRRQRTRRARKAGVPTDGHTRAEVWERDSGVCQLCGVQLDPQTWQEDHVIPIALDGPDTLENVQASCPSCNRRKWMKVG
jgi:5-methylcytosine-specific restriction endonuclease McrA